MVLSAITLQFAGLCWAVFIIVWAVGALFTKRTVEKPRWWNWQFITPIAVIAALLLARYGGGYSYLVLIESQLWQYNIAIAVFGDILVLCGLAVALWSRKTLGGNWSGSVVFKENHELVTSGPYRYVRHPIYSGMLLMLIGTVLASASAMLLFVWAVSFVTLWLKSREEEKLMARHFPSQYPAYLSRTKALIPRIL